MSETSTSDLTAQYLVPNYGRFPLAFARGEGSWLWDESGRRYLDFATGVAVCSLGHCPEVMVQAIEKQARELIHCSNLYQIRRQAELAHHLVENVVRLPGKCFFCNSGAEANDALIKLARKYGHEVPGPDGRIRYEVLTFRQSFHGRTLGGISATGQDKVKEGFDPMLPGFRHLPFNDVETLKSAITEETVGILFEAVQGEGGINIATPGFMKVAAELCFENDLLLMLDEVQCGIGRTGKMNGWEAVLEGTGVEVHPDVVSWAKGLGGGFPIGGIWIRGREIQTMTGAKTLPDILGPGTHGSTFGGTPLASAAALAVLREIEDQRLPENAARHCAYIKEQVATWESPFIRELRGLGLMLGFVLDVNAIGAVAGFRESGSTPGLYIVRRLMDAGLLTVAAGPEVVRWLPALNVSRAEVDEALAIMRTELEKL